MTNQCPNYKICVRFLCNNSIIVSNDMKRTEKDLHISLFRLNFAAKCKKQLTNVATFRKNAYLCAVVS